MITIGTKTLFGVVGAVLWCGERYYMLMDKVGTVSLMPASVVEPEMAAHQKGQP